MTYEPDDEARELAWQRAARRQNRSVVRADFCPEAWATTADPTAILDERPDPYTAESDGLLLLHIDVDTTPLIEAIKVVAQVCDDIAAAWVKTATAVSGAFAGTVWQIDELIVFVTASADQPEMLNRRRHGTASICPRHGPAVGGLCRRCARRRSTRREW